MRPLLPPRSSPSRDALLAELTARPACDVLVVGGGITGVAVARDAALRGLRVVLVEAGDLASGTSSRSSRLVHGGLRYLESLEFSLVHEGLTERALLLAQAPGLVRAVDFLYPVHTGEAHRLGSIQLGTLLYDLLAGSAGLGAREILTPAEIAACEPGLERPGLTGGVLYRDGATHDARLTLAVARAAAAAGALLLTRVAAVDLIRGADSRVTGARLLDRIAGRELPALAARSVALCTGPWEDLHADIPPVIRTARGSHVAVPRERLPLIHFLALTAPQDGRLTFAMPIGDSTVLGTTDEVDPSAPDAVMATPGDVAYLLEVARHNFPAHPLTPADVRGVWAGQRPLIADPEVSDGDALSRHHQVVSGGPGLWILAGGKLTAQRRMAEDLVDAIVAADGPVDAGPCRTAGRTLIEGDLDGARRRLASAGLPPGRIEEWIGLYGAAAGELAPALAAGIAPLAAQTARGVDDEWCLALDDLLLRRLSPGPLDLYACLDRAAAAAGSLATRLGWSRGEQEAQLEAFRDGILGVLATAGLPPPR